jgi:hypothetical protein
VCLLGNRSADTDAERQSRSLSEKPGRRQPCQNQDRTVQGSEERQRSFNRQTRAHFGNLEVSIKCNNLRSALSLRKMSRFGVCFIRRQRVTPLSFTPPADRPCAPEPTERHISSFMLIEPLSCSNSLHVFSEELTPSNKKTEYRQAGFKLMARVLRASCLLIKERIWVCSSEVCADEH